MRNQFINYFEHFGIDPDRIQTESRVKDKDIKNFIDPIEVKNGKSPVLIRIVGKRRIRTKIVPLDSSSLTDTSVVVLDNGMKIYQWSGKSAPRVVKAKGWDLTNKIRTKERGGLASVINLEQGKDSNAEFWNLLGGKPVPKKTSEEALKKMREQQDEEDKQGDSIRIYKIGDIKTPKESRIKLIHEGNRPPPKEFLQFDSVCIVDCDNEIYIWIGKDATTHQRKLGLIVALKLQNQDDRNEYTIISRVFDKGETILFKEKFSNYPGMLPIHVGKHEKKKNLIASSKEQEPIDVIKMHEYNPPKPNFYDDEKIAGKIIKVWKIEGFDKKELDESLFGQLWSGDSFVIVYRYPYQNKEKNLVYFWQGKFSSRNEKGTSAYLTVDVSDEIGKDVEQVRVVQDKEEEHFLRVMKKYNFVIHEGKFDANREITNHLYSIRGDNELAHPIEVPLHCSHLNTLHCYVILTTSHCYLWKGALSNKFEFESANIFCKSFNLPIIIATEGTDDSSKDFEHFWRLLGGKSKYYGYDGSVDSRKPHRLFTCSNSTGSVIVEEIYDFAQEDTLNYHHIFIFDIFHEVFVWIGNNTVALEKRLAMEAAIEYVTTSKIGHSPDTPIWVIYPFAEPLAFTVNFPTWSREKYPVNQRAHVPSQIPVMNVLQDYLPKTYAYEELLKDPLPPGVDSTRLEQYLTDEEFEKVFKMPRTDFMSIPAWKAERIKQDVGLF